ncbi:hypothetical protein DEU56DRAFT_759622 [Suillus clintonianus]|uniref:uncharacterized protein n=1 Tax=Suillus clintonianus TaxID=1904413 RepID=UPI001B866F99|nr:uncharacterized protein DEU56DRAFT_759622 [Suillus clintonianus]KAG2124681.1 hypothetical protein DEU56DRAFT_759622 [Suillus clintonianus]
MTRPLVDFMMGGTAAAISKTVAAPIERVKLLIQNQGAMVASGRLDRLYKGVTDCFKRTVSQEGNSARINATNVLRYFPTQALNFTFKDTFKQFFGFEKSKGFSLWVLGMSMKCQETLPVEQPLEYLPLSLCIHLISIDNRNGCDAAPVHAYQLMDRAPPKGDNVNFVV